MAAEKQGRELRVPEIAIAGALLLVFGVLNILSFVAYFSSSFRVLYDIPGYSSISDLAAVLSLVFGFVYVAVGAMVYNKHELSFWPGIIVSVFALISIPIGTIIGIVCLALLIRNRKAIER